jgi:hypothetical protein
MPVLATGDRRGKTPVRIIGDATFYIKSKNGRSGAGDKMAAG